MSSGDKLRSLAAKRSESDTNKANCEAYIADRVEHGGWSEADVAEYMAAVSHVMKNGTDDERLAAREFWALKAKENKSIYPGKSSGINERIQSANDDKKQEAA